MEGCWGGGGGREAPGEGIKENVTTKIRKRLQGGVHRVIVKAIFPLR